MMPFAVAGLVVLVAVGMGGYDPWAVLALEVGASALFLWCLVDIFRGTRPAERIFYLARRGAWKRLPFLVRHRSLGMVVRVLTLGIISSRGGGTEVEIFPPGADSSEVGKRRPEHYFVWGGYPFRRTGLGWPVLFLTLWIGLSLVPLDEGALAALSPAAHALRQEANTVTSGRDTWGSAPWSLAPFMTLGCLWLWAAYLGIFYAGVHLARDARKIERFFQCLFVAGMLFGVWGIGQWAAGVQELFGADPSTAGLRASASFGNRNHYAAFMEMLLLCGMGWLGARWALFQTDCPVPGPTFWRRVNLMARESGAKLVLTGLGIVFLALGLIFSLSRSGISFALAGCAVFVLLAPRAGFDDAGTVELTRRARDSRRGGRAGRARSATHWVLAVLLVVVGVAAWIGLDPVVHRFELLPDEWDAEESRWQVWNDSLGAVRDYTLTGTGLGTYRYVYPIYRSWGGIVFYSWAHNDYLQALVELGLPGFVLVVVIMVGIGRRAFRIRRDLADEPWLVFLHAGCAAGVVATALHSLTDFGLHMPANGALFSAMVGILVGLEGDEAARPSRDVHRGDHRPEEPTPLSRLGVKDHPPRLP